MFCKKLFLLIALVGIFLVNSSSFVNARAKEGFAQIDKGGSNFVLPEKFEGKPSVWSEDSGVSIAETIQWLNQNLSLTGVYEKFNSKGWLSVFLNRSLKNQKCLIIEKYMSNKKGEGASTWIESFLGSKIGEMHILEEPHYDRPGTYREPKIVFLKIILKEGGWVSSKRKDLNWKSESGSLDWKNEWEDQNSKSYIYFPFRNFEIAEGAKTAFYQIKNICEKEEGEPF